MKNAIRLRNTHIGPAVMFFLPERLADIRKAHRFCNSICVRRTSSKKVNNMFSLQRERKALWAKVYKKT